MILLVVKCIINKIITIFGIDFIVNHLLEIEAHKRTIPTVIKAICFSTHFSHNSCVAHEPRIFSATNRTITIVITKRCGCRVLHIHNLVSMVFSANMFTIVKHIIIWTTIAVVEVVDMINKGTINGC